MQCRQWGGGITTDLSRITFPTITATDLYGYTSCSREQKSWKIGESVLQVSLPLECLVQSQFNFNQIQLCNTKFNICKSNISNCRYVSIDFLPRVVTLKTKHRRLVSSVGRAPVGCSGGRGFEPQTGPTLRVLK